MENLVPLGTGNSRLMKSNIPSNTTLAQLIQMWNNGTFPYDIGPLNSAGISQQGTPLNKDTLLKDATAALFGLGSDAVPDDMFNVLTHAGDLHVWKRVKTTGESTYTLGEEQIGNKILSNQNDTIGGMTWHYSSSVLVSSTGDISLVNEETVTVNQNTVANGQKLVGKFAYPEKTGSGFSAGAVVFFPSDAVVTYTGGWTQISKYQSVTVVPPGTYVDYPVSPNRNAYQEGSDAQPAGYTLGAVQSGKFSLCVGSRNDATASYKYGTTLIVSDDGNVDISGSDTVTLNALYGNAVTIAQQRFLGKYIKLTGKSNNATVSFTQGQVYFIPADATISGVGTDSPTVDQYQTVTGYPAIPAGTTIEYMGQVGDKARIETGSYVGTGKYGSSNPNSLTFGFVPQIVVIGSNSSSASNASYCVLSNNGYFCPVFSGFGGGVEGVLYGVVPAFNERSVSWFSASNAVRQLNASGITYNYIALG